MLTLYFAPGSSSMAPHIALHEVGAPFESRPLSFHRKQNRDPAYLAINPEGKVPTLLIDGRPLTEVAGILFYLARRFPAGRPAARRRRRGRGAGGVVDVVHRRDVHPARRQGLEHARAGLSHRRAAAGRTELGGGTLLDRRHPSVPAVLALPRRRSIRQPGEFPHLSAHYERMMARPAVQKTIEIEAAIGYELPA